MSEGIRPLRASLVLALVMAWVIVPGEPATAQTPACPNEMQTASIAPAPEFTPAAVSSNRARNWLRLHPMPISGLVPTLPNPPKTVVDRYLEPFGANLVHLWMDGPGQAESWLQHRRGTGFITWLSPDGTSLAWNGSQFVDTGQLMGGLAPSTPGRIGFQVGDEPSSAQGMTQIATGIDRIRATDPNALLFTNLTYWLPNFAEMVQQYVSSVNADLVLTGDYNFEASHYTVLETFRDAGLAKGVPYWQYLNAYVGQETDCQLTHTRSDLLWQAMAGLTYGYTGHFWFIYQAAAVGHESATNWGGSILLQPTGTWDASPTGYHGILGDVNQRLANLGKAVTRLTSTDVRFIRADDPLSEQPIDTQPWSPGAGGFPYLVGVAPAPGQAPLEILLGFFIDENGERYIVVQNARHTHSTRRPNPPLPGSDSVGTINLTFDFGTAPAGLPTDRIRVLRSVDGVRGDLPLTDLGGTLRRADIILEAGDAVMLKYATEGDFVFGPARETVGLVDPTQGIWYLPRGDQVTSFYYGNPGDTPFMGDWDCDGIDTPGLYRRSDGFVYLRDSNTQGVADVRYFFGNPADIPIAGDFDGDGCDTVSIYRPLEGKVYVINRLGSGASGVGAADLSYYFGNPGDKPFAGDFDGNGIDTIGLHRETTGLVYFRNTHTQGVADHQFFFGNPADLLVAGDWTGVGFSTPALFRPDEARFFFRHTNTQGIADNSFFLGNPGWLPVAGSFG
ncbi:MAG TPA: hypothetical protein VJA46_09430 [Acidimicrobiia bacterium]|nr:hypothetical protein [Acidimicrobiia bacterium]